MHQQRIIAELADKIRAYYIAARRRHEESRTGRPSSYLPGPWWDGGKMRGSNTVRKNQWLNVAKKLSARSIDYQAFIDYLFDTFKMNAITDRDKYAPQVNMLLSFNRQDAFLQHESSEASRERRRRAFQAQKRIVHAAILDQLESRMHPSRVDVIKYVIADSSLELSALFRFCLAHDEAQQRLKDFYRDQALMQYGRNIRQYNETWKDWIPGDLKQEAALVFQAHGETNGTSSTRTAGY